jgi:hypothetical protein
MNQDECKELAKRRERLHPALAEYLMETPGGLMLNHPLVQESPGLLDPDRAAHLNWRYREKRKLDDEARASRNWSEVIFLRERPYRVRALIELADVLPDKEYWALVSDV